MKRSLLFFYIISFQFFSLSSQSWDWVKNYNPGATDIGTSIGIDKQSNLYITGYSRYTTGGGGVSYHHPVFWKLDSVGNAIWTQTLGLGGPSVTDTSGYTYITGQNKIVKFNNSGQIEWVVNIQMWGMFQSIALHHMEDIIILGSKLSNDSSTFQSVLMHYDSYGNYLWSKSGTFPLSNKIICDKDDNIYIIGTGSKDTATINFGLLTKCDSNGNIIYNRTIPATPTEIVIDSKKNIYVTGWFGAIPININGIVYPGDHTKEFQFLIKYDPNGKVLWHKVYDQGRHVIAIDDEDNLYATFYYGGNLPGITAQAGNLIVMKMDSLGNMLWYKNSEVVIPPPGYLAGYVEAYAMIIKNNDVFITGAISGTQKFDNFVLSSDRTYTDMFVAKISPPKDVSVREIKKNENALNFNIYPNPSTNIFTLSIAKTQTNREIKINVIDVLGKTVYTETIKNFNGSMQKEINLEGISKGTYIIKLISNDFTATKKIVVE